MVENLFKTKKNPLQDFLPKSERCNLNQWEHWIYRYLQIPTENHLGTLPYTHSKCEKKQNPNMIPTLAAIKDKA